MGRCSLLSLMWNSVSEKSVLSLFYGGLGSNGPLPAVWLTAVRELVSGSTEGERSPSSCKQGKLVFSAGSLTNRYNIIPLQFQRYVGRQLNWFTLAINIRVPGNTFVFVLASC